MLPATIGAMPVGRTTPGFAATRFEKRITTMLRTLSAVVVAMSLIGGPVLAQGAANAPATTSQPAAKADTAKTVSKTDVKMVKKTRHHAVKLVKHVKHVKHAKHFKHVKQVKHPAKNKTAG
jgi:methylthioribose-1-phosphate isomerase